MLSPLWFYLQTAEFHLAANGLLLNGEDRQWLLETDYLCIIAMIFPRPPLLSQVLGELFDWKTWLMCMFLFLDQFVCTWAWGAQSHAMRQPELGPHSYGQSMISPAELQGVKVTQDEHTFMTMVVSFPLVKQYVSPMFITSMWSSQKQIIIE